MQSIKNCLQLWVPLVLFDNNKNNNKGAGKTSLLNLLAGRIKNTKKISKTGEV